jgi:hypothetical protein
MPVDCVANRREADQAHGRIADGHRIKSTGDGTYRVPR